MDTVVAYLCGDKFFVEYEKIMVDEEGTKGLQETAKRSQLRPIPPEEIIQDFQLGDAVDAYDNDGWWEGGISRYIAGGRGGFNIRPGWAIAQAPPGPNKFLGILKNNKLKFFKRKTKEKLEKRCNAQPPSPSPLPSPLQHRSQSHRRRRHNFLPTSSSQNSFSSGKTVYFFRVQNWDFLEWIEFESYDDSRRTQTWNFSN